MAASAAPRRSDSSGAPLGGARRGGVPPAPLAQEAAARAPAQCPASPGRSPRASCSRSPRATTSNRGSSCATERAASLAHGPFRRADFKALPARNWTLLVQGVNLVDPTRRRAAAPVLVPAVRAPRRPDGELRRAGRRRRPARRFATTCSCCRASAAAAGATARQGDLALDARTAAQDPAALRARPTTKCSRRATCSTCRRTSRTTASPSTHARPIRSAFARRRATELGSGVPRLPARRARSAGALCRPRPRARPRAGAIGAATCAGVVCDC